MSSCKGCKKSSHLYREINESFRGLMPPHCHDVCINPICGTPDVLTMMSPVIYDELGINLCRNIPIPTADLAKYPTATKASVQILTAEFIKATGEETEETTVNPIPERPLCMEVKLTNVKFSLAISLYDCCGKYLGTSFTEATYLPSEKNSAVAYYDEDNNPHNATLEIFAPYGGTYEDTGGTPKYLRTIKYIGFTDENSCLCQGLVMTTIPKVLDTTISSGTITLGITIFLQSIYFSQYNIPTTGRSEVPHANPSSDDTLCSDFVEGELLDWAIKPLELDPPKCEEHLKKECPSTPSCNIITP